MEWISECTLKDLLNEWWIDAHQGGKLVGDEENNIATSTSLVTLGGMHNEKQC